MFNVIEKFISIDGEGPSAGELAAFIRFSGCDLRCAWCDTKYSWDGSTPGEKMTAEEIFEFIKQSGVANVTVTGGEPLIQKNIDSFLAMLAADESLTIRIETNGARPIASLKERFKEDNVQFILDFKLPASQMTHKMCFENFDAIDPWDVYKFVIASQEDLDMAISLVKKYGLTNRCRVFFSPVVEMFDPKKIVEAMMEEQLNGVRFQLQLHKYIWPKDMRGV